MYKHYPSWFLFLMMIILGNYLVLSTMNWFVVWMGFEISLFGFLPMFVGSSVSVEGVTKYFLVQVQGSALFLMGILLHTDLLVVLGMLLKCGAFPFFQWVSSVYLSMSWGGILVLSTLQKLPSLCVISGFMHSNVNLIMVAASLSVLVSGCLGYNQIMLKGLMGYSSVAHSGWSLMALLVGKSFFFVYFGVYSVSAILLFSCFCLGNRTHFETTSSVGFDFFNLINLSGLPPFFLFVLKVSIMLFLVSSGYLIYLLPVVAGGILSAYYYLHVVLCLSWLLYIWIWNLSQKSFFSTI